MDHKFQCEYARLFNMSLCIAHSAVKTPAAVLKPVVHLKQLTSLQFLESTTHAQDNFNEPQKHSA